MTIGSDTSFQLRTSSPLYKQYTNTIEHIYTKATVFLNNSKNNNMKCTSATQFEIYPMINRTDLYNKWTSL